MRKALQYHMLSAFEPKRSNPRKQFNEKALLRTQLNHNRNCRKQAIQIKPAAISTVGGD
jgi:hypothetical protein